MLREYFLIGETRDWVIRTSMDYTYDSRLVVLSCLVAIFASYAAFQLVVRVRAAPTRFIRLAWLATGTVAMGGGIWSMHFIGMLAVTMPVEVRYDAVLTVLSVVFSVAGSATAFHLVSQGVRTAVRLAAGGVLLGGGIGAMHYTGMAAMQMDDGIRYDPLLFAVSVLVAVSLATLALRLLFLAVESGKTRSRVVVPLSGCVMGLAIAAMHYTAMAATYFVPRGVRIETGLALDTALMAGTIAVAAVIIIGLAMVAALVDHRLEMKDREVEQSAEFLAAVVNNIADGIIASDQDGTVRMYNPAAKRMFGYDKNEIIGQNVALLLQPEERSANDDDVGESQLQAPRILGVRRALTGRHKDGSSIDLEISTSVMARAEGDMFLGVCHDITERKRMQERMQETQKLEAIGQLAGGIAHDFNNLLMVIDGYARRARNKIDDAKLVDECLEAVLQSAEAAADLTKQILTFGARQVMQKRTVRAAEALVEVEQLLRPLLGERFEVALDVADQAACVEIDPSELSQAVVNLALNGRDAMIEGGTITVGTGIRQVDEDFVQRHPELQTGTYVGLWVRDQGIGIDADDLAHIFEPFFTTKDQGKGTGLGLAMVYGFVRQAGGAIEVASEPGEGSTFTIYLPLAETPVVEELPDETDTAPAGAGGTVLLAEDDERLRHLVQLTLEELGYNVICAADGFEAIERDSEHDGPIHVVLSDVVMPVMGGYEVVRILRENRPDIKVVLMSGYPARDDLQDLEVPEDATFLQKPVKPKALAEVLGKALAS